MIELLSYEKMNTHTFDCWTFENVISNEVLKQVIWMIYFIGNEWRCVLIKISYLDEQICIFFISAYM